MTFGDYYRELFERDLRAVVNGLQVIEMHRNEGLIIQPRFLSLANPAIKGLPAARLELLVNSLYFALLLDQCVRRELNQLHSRFHELTGYPELLGDCPGACHSYLEAAAVFAAIGKQEGDMSYGEFDVAIETLRSQVGGFKSETTRWFHQYFPDADIEKIWSSPEFAKLLEPA